VCRGIGGFNQSVETMFAIVSRMSSDVTPMSSNASAWILLAGSRIAASGRGVERYGVAIAGRRCVVDAL